jgi:hypothetical protein
MKEFLESADKELAGNRDKSKYRHKGNRKACIKTKMGEVEYTRAIYEVKEEGISKSMYFYLTKSLGWIQ